MEILKFVQYQKKINKLIFRQKKLKNKADFFKNAFLVMLVVNVCLFFGMFMYAKATTQQLAMQKTNEISNIINK